MGYLRTMGPGCAGSTVRYKGVNVNQIQFGDKLQGLPPVTGSRRPHKIYKRKAGGNAPGRYRVFCINQLGGSMVKNSQFAANADGIAECHNKRNSRDGFVGIHDTHHPTDGKSSSHIPRYMDAVQFFSGMLLDKTVCHPEFYQYTSPTQDSDIVIFSELGASESCITRKINTSIVNPDVDIAISCAGGGARAYTTSIAALAALEKRNIISRNGKSCVKLLVSNSGGSWANMVYSYGAPDSVEGKATAEEFLGTGNAEGNCPMNPADIKKDNVAHLSKKNARYATSQEESNIKQGWEWIISHTDIPDFWKAQIIKYYMEPYNITDKVMDCSNGEHNSFDSIFVGTLAGPSKLGPFKVGNLSLLEMSPFYIGTKTKKDLKYEKKHLIKKETLTLSLGNFTSSDPCPTDDESDTKFTIGDIVQTSSWAPGVLFSARGITSHLNLKRDLYFKSQVDKVDKVNCILSDGGAVDNQAIIPSIQRNIKNIFIISNVDPDGKFAYDDEANNVNINWEFRSYFDQLLTNQPPKIAGTDVFDTTHSHIFEKEGFMALVKSMRDSHDTGDGILCSTVVTTVKNDWYGIPAGQTHNIILLYPNVPEKWLAQINDSYVKNIITENNLPYVGTTMFNVPTDQSNLMASMVTWTIDHRIDDVITEPGLCSQ